MATQFVRHKVADYRASRKVDDEFAPTPRALENTADVAYQAAEDPNDVTVSHQFGSLDAARAFLASLELHGANSADRRPTAEPSPSITPPHAFARFNMKRLFAAMTAVLLMAALAPAAASGRGPLPITGAGHIDNAEDTGTCGNTWALDSLGLAYKLTLTKAGTYNLEVRKDGTFTTIAGTSPGACEKTGRNNGKTVNAGVTGTTHQEFNATVTSTAKPHRNPNCANSDCTSSSSFLNAVFGSGEWARGAWSFTGDYSTISNGTWFDTSVDWPFNDSGDITS